MAHDAANRPGGRAGGRADGRANSDIARNLPA